jgi:dihydroorotase
MRFDLLIRGGEVVDPGGGHAGLLDVAVSRGRVAAVDRGIPEAAAYQVVDASGQIVTPGLVDLHTHVFHKLTYWGIDPDPVASRSGVTTWNDAGSAGALTLEGFREFIVRPARVRITGFVNISSIGLVCDDYEIANPWYCDVDLLRRIVDRSRDVVVGVKVRMGNLLPLRGEPLDPLRRAREAADATELPLMMHISFGPPSLEEVLPFLKPGDVLTHCFTGHPMRIVDEEGRLREAAERAWESGVVFDVGHGTGSFSFETAEAVMGAGRKPDVISTDLHQLSVNGPTFDLPTTLSKFLHLGMSLPEVIEASTVRPAAVLGLGGEVGTLRPGAQADVALFRLYEGSFSLQDIHGNVRDARRLLRNTKTFVGGRELGRLPLPPRAAWAQEPVWPDVQIPFTEKQRQRHEQGRTPDAMAAVAGEPADG